MWFIRIENISTNVRISIKNKEQTKSAKFAFIVFVNKSKQLSNTIYDTMPV